MQAKQHHHALDSAPDQHGFDFSGGKGGVEGSQGCACRGSGVISMLTNTPGQSEDSWKGRNVAATRGEHIAVGCGGW